MNTAEKAYDLFFGWILLITAFGTLVGMWGILSHRGWGLPLYIASWVMLIIAWIWWAMLFRRETNHPTVLPLEVEEEEDQG